MPPPARLRGYVSRLPPFLGGELHRLDDFGIRRAAAEIPGQVMAYLVFAGIRMLVQELPRHQHEPGGAEAALEGARLDERLLHRIQLAAAFNSLYVRAFGERREVQAPGHRGALDQHGAAAAEPLPAALARAVEPERVAQHLNQRLVRRDLRLDAFTIELEL